MTDCINLVDRDTDSSIDKENTANYINNYFSEIGPNLAQQFNNNWSYDGEEIDNILPDFSVNEREVINICKNIETHKSSAIDLFSSRILKDAFLTLSKELTHLINLIFTTATFPTAWKNAKVIPLFKGGDNSDVSNYRPISLLPLPGKIVEAIIHSKIIEHLDNLDFLSDKQDGFRPGRSTIDTIAGFTDDIALETNKGHCTIATFVDLKKAFDTINHNILLQKLGKAGINGLNHSLLQSYLTGRSQCTIANSTVSPQHYITCGVPQGSILGPLLFLIYINDLANNLQNCFTRLYADDTVIYTYGPTKSEASAKLQNSVDSLSQWCEKNQLTININKTKVMFFGTRKMCKQISDVSVKLNNRPLEYVKTFKYLGVNLDMELKFNVHAKAVYKLASHKTNILRLIRPYITEFTATQIYKMKILPYIDYGDIFYMSSNAESLENLNKLQYRALRICQRAHHRTARVDLLTRGKLPLLCYRRTCHLRNYMYKRSIKKKYLVKPNINTRFNQAPVFDLPKSDIKMLDRSIIVKGGKDWNGLSAEIRNTATRDKFKSIQKKWLYSMIPV